MDSNKPIRQVRTNKLIPDVFSDTEVDKIASVNDTISPFEAIQKPELPELYNKLDELEPGRISKQKLYSLLERTTPYLIKNLLYLSNSESVAHRVRMTATKTLLERILPTLNADHIKLETDNLQSLVIVKSDVKKS